MPAAQKLKFLSLLIACLWFACLPALAGALEDGIEAYYQRRYNAASLAFADAAAQNPRNWKAHFYLARALEQLKEFEDAKIEYMVVFQLNPFSPEGRLARQALMDLAATVESRKHHTDDPEIVRQALRQINMQAGDLKSRTRSQAEITASLKQREAFRRLYGIDPGERSQRFYRRNMYYNNEDEVSNRRYIRQSYIRTDAMRSAALARLEAAKRAEETQKSANNLKLLIADNNSKSSNPKLRALGTNLYVRNYMTFEQEDVAPDDPPLQLRAKAKSLAELPQYKGFMKDRPVPILETVMANLPEEKNIPRPGLHSFNNWTAPPKASAAPKKSPPGKTSKSRALKRMTPKQAAVAKQSISKLPRRHSPYYHKFGAW